MYPFQLDLLIRDTVHSFNSKALTELAFTLSFIGSPFVLTALFLAAGGFLLRMRLPLAARTLAVVMIGEIVLQNGLKLLIARPRPEPFFGATPENYSFPSGHALSTFCFFGTLALLARKRVESPAVGRAILATAIVVVVAIGWSRIYLGVHYPSDVVGGYAIGAVWIGLLIIIRQFRNEPAAASPATVRPPLASAMLSLRPVLVVMSRNSGTLRDRPAMQTQLRPLLEAAGLAATFADLEAPDISEQINRAARDGARAIVAAGGDGTISFVGQKLVSSKIPLGVIPLGTMNLFAKDLGIATDDLGAAVAVLGGFRVREIDVGEVNGHVFLCGSVLGLPAWLARYRTRGNTWRESGRLWIRYGRALLRASLHYRPFRATLVSPDRSLRISACSLLVTPNPINDRSGPLLGRSQLEGGRLAVYVVGRLRAHDVIRLTMRALFHRWQRDALVSRCQVRRLAVVSRSAAVRVMNDGEIAILNPPLHYRVLPRALHVICPGPVPTDAVCNETCARLG